MEPSRHVAEAEITDIVVHIDQKAMRLSALLREVDNAPLELSHSVRERLDGILEQLSCRITATRALLHQEGTPVEDEAELAGANA